jgi:hypothetical protein
MLRVYAKYIIRYRQQERRARNPGRRVSAGTSGTVFPAKAAVFYKIRPHFPSFFQKKLLSGIFRNCNFSRTDRFFFLLKKIAQFRPVIPVKIKKWISFDF